VLDREEQRCLRAACDLRSHQGWRDEALLSVLLDSGLRPRELCHLRLDAFTDITTCMVSGKAGQREVRLGLDAALTLWEYVSFHRRPAYQDEGAILLTDDGQPLDVPTLTQLVQAIGERAGLGPGVVTPHVLRRTMLVQWWRLHQSSCAARAAKGEQA
jgi:site-specific recombinase XerD